MDSTIGKGYIVRSRGSITITGFGGTKGGSGVVISHSISIVVGSGHISISWGMVGSSIRGRVVRSWGRVIRSRCRMVGLRTSVTFPSMTRDTGFVITGSKILIKSGSVTAVECVLLAIFVTEMIDLIIVTRLVTYK